MRKSVHRAGHHANTPGVRKPRRAGTPRRRNTPARREAPEPRRLLDRILETPHLAHVVRQLEPEMLHRVIQTCGLEDCGELVALTTSDQLTRLFDLDLWGSGEPGDDEQFDADRFGVWLEVLLESGAAVAAQRLADMDLHLVITALAQHARVVDPAAAVHSVADGPSVDVGGYRIAARRTGSWDAIIAVLIALDVEHPGCFHRVMRGCRSLSNSIPEIDGLDGLLTVGEQAMFDLAVDRERRREQQGYVTPAQARAFLQISRQLRLGDDGTPAADVVARAYFRAIEWPTAADADAESVSRRLPTAAAPPAPDDLPGAVAALVDVLLDSGVLPRQPRALLEGGDGQAPRLARIQTHMQFARDRDDAAYSSRSQELAYLTNAIVAGCQVQGRPLELAEASQAAVAVCNLGLENWPSRWLPGKGRVRAAVVAAGAALPDDFLVGQDLIRVFQVGWTVLHQDVCMHAAGQMLGILADMRCSDPETQAGLAGLRRELTRQWQAGTPWRAADALDVIAILDMPAWAALLGLIAECPVIHAGIGAAQDPGTRAVSASAFEFISENRQIVSVHEFMRSLPEALRG